MNEFIPISEFAQALPWSSSAMEYLVDRTQRTILFWDVLRKRGNNYLAHLRAGQPPVLVFDYEMVLDGRTFEQPVNYSLIHILDRRSKEDKPVRQTERRSTRKTAAADSALPIPPIVSHRPTCRSRTWNRWVKTEFADRRGAGLRPSGLLCHVLCRSGTRADHS